jgi:hypothetical protein
MDAEQNAVEAHRERVERARGLWQVTGDPDESPGAHRIGRGPDLRRAAASAFDEAWEDTIDAGMELRRRFDRLAEESDALRLHGLNTLVVFPDASTQAAWVEYQADRGLLPAPRLVERAVVIPETEVTPAPRMPHEDEIAERVAASFDDTLADVWR